MKIKCLVVDDEPLACNLLEDFIVKIDFLELVDKCCSSLEAIQVMQTEKVDVVFLDIQMPEMTGIDFLESINKKPKIIFTTAYEDYAVESYNFEAVDYLLKPFTFSRFLKAIDKLTSNSAIGELQTEQTSGQSQIDFLFVSDSGKTVKVDLNDIFYFKGMGDYITIKTPNRTYIIRDNLKRIEELLANSNFIRIHKSYIISISKIDSIEGSEVVISNEKLSIGPLYKNYFKQIVSKLKIG